MTYMTKPYLLSFKLKIKMQVNNYIFKSPTMVFHNSLFHLLHNVAYEFVFQMCSVQGDEVECVLKYIQEDTLTYVHSSVEEKLSIVL